MAYHNELGKLGEQLAVTYFVQNGYTILQRNYTFEKAEIDIVAQKDNLIVFIEVKTRNSNFFGDPQSFVSNGKIRRIVKAANEYLIAHDIEMEARFDLVAIVKNKHVESLEHFENAFYHF